MRFWGWLLDIKLINEVSGGFEFNFRFENLKLDSDHGRKIYGIRRGKARGTKVNTSLFYWPQVSPAKVKKFYEIYSQDVKRATDLIAIGNKKVLEDLISLRIAMVTAEDEVVLNGDFDILCSKVKERKNISYALSKMKKSPESTAKQLGQLVDLKFGKQWSDATLKVTGGMIYRWVKELM